MLRATLQTPTGPVTVSAAGDAITAVGWGGGFNDDSALLREAARQLTAYFDGSREAFDLPLRVGGSDFQRTICAAIMAIPYGETITYGDIAKTVNAPAQAVGQACGGNPIPIIIPCHRVLGATGLGGFSGGTGAETKVALLRLEGALLV